MGRPSRSRVGAALIGALALAGCKSLGRDAQIEPRITYWRPETNGEIVVTAGSKPGTGSRTRLDNDLGLAGDNQFVGALDLQFDNQRFGFDYEPLHFHGSKTVELPYVFHGATYPNGDHVKSDLDLVTYGLRWEYRFSEPKRRSTDAFWLGIGAWWWNFDMQAIGSVSGNDERRSFSHVYPGVNAEWILDLSNGLTLDLDGCLCLNKIDSRIYDLSAGFAYGVSDGARLVVGYRYQRWDFNESTNDGDFVLLGPFASLTLRL